MRGLALRRIEQLADVERFAFQPRFEARRGQQIVQRHRQLEAILGGIERFEIEHADRVIGGFWIAWISASMVRFSPFRQALSKMFESRMCSRLFIGSASMPSSDSTAVAAPVMRSRNSSAIFQQSAVGRGEGFQKRKRNAGVAARRVDREVGGRLQAPNAFAALSPLCEACCATDSACAAANCSRVTPFAFARRPR